jgi:Fe-S cluster assembly iron-binding protein IscA
MSETEVKLSVTKEAQDQVRDLMKSQKPGTAVRVYIQSGGGGGGCGSGGCGSSGGGCGCGGGGGGGTAFGMAFDKPRNGDQVISVDGISIVVDDMSAGLLNGATIDFVQDLNVSGFKITSPNTPTEAEHGHGAESGGGCGCGSGGCGGG